MSTLNFGYGSALSGDQKLWILNKVRSHYKSDPYLKYLDRAALIAPLKLALLNSETIEDLYENLKRQHVSNRPLSFTRKQAESGTLYFETPSLEFQIRSVIGLWPFVCKTYSRLDDENRTRYGHRPNLETYFPPNPKKNKARLREFNQNFLAPLKVDYKKEYSEFKTKLVATSKNLLSKEKDGLRRRVVVAQTDIKSFFHQLTLDTVQRTLESDPSFGDALRPYIKELKAEFKSNGVPIGWMLGGVLVDLMLKKVHDCYSNELFAKVRHRLKNISLQEIEDFIPKKGVDKKIAQRLEVFFKETTIYYKNVFSYVDDFIFMSVFDSLERDKTILKFAEKIIGVSIVQEAEKILEDCLKNGRKLEFYTSEYSKLRVFSFDKSNVDTLESNFFQFANPNNYADSEQNLWSRLEEFLLPADNDLDLNERSQFAHVLNNLRKNTISGKKVEQADVDAIFSKIRVKVEGDEAKYIQTIVRLLETLIIADFEDVKRFKFYLEKLSELVEVYSTQKSLELGLRLFDSFFRIYEKLDFNEKLKFFRSFENYIEVRKADSASLDDIRLLESIRITYYIRRFAKQGQKTRSLNQPKVSKISSRLHLNSCYSAMLGLLNAHHSQGIDGFAFQEDVDVVCAADVLDLLFRSDQTVTVSSYFGLCKSIKKKFGADTAGAFLRLSAYNVFPHFSVDESERLLEVLETFFPGRGYGTIFSDAISCAERRFAELRGGYQDRIRAMLDGIDHKLESPTSLGKKSCSNPWALAFMLWTSTATTRGECLRMYLYTLVDFQSAVIPGWQTLPLTEKRNGMAFLKALQVVVESQVSFDRSGFSNQKKTISRVKKALSSELHEDSDSALENFKRESVASIDGILEWARKKNDARKKAVKGGLRLTVAPLGLEAKNFKHDQGFRYDFQVCNHLQIRIEAAVEAAVKEGADIIVFPELSIPRRFLLSTLKLCARNNLILIGGLEYYVDRYGNATNSTVISFPVDELKNPLGRKFVAFEQIKHFPSAEEKHLLEVVPTRRKYFYVPGDTLFVFRQKDFNFAVLTCSDFLSMKLRLKLQESVQLVFVPAQNKDNTSYDHIAESSIRDLHCYAVICNNLISGSSFIYAPYYNKEKRTLLKIVGRVSPEFSTVTINPGQLVSTQAHDSQSPFRLPDLDEQPERSTKEHFKQLPPDWAYPKRRRLPVS